MRHAEFGVIVPVGIVAALYSILVGSFEDVALALGRTWYRGDVLTRVWYWTILSGLGALFCAYFAVKARFTLIRILASFMAVGLASRVVMTWRLSHNPCSLHRSAAPSGFRRFPFRLLLLCSSMAARNSER